MPQSLKYTTIIFDLVGTLFNVSFQTNTSIPPSTLRLIPLCSNAWFNYERGHLSAEECYSRIAADFDLDKDELRRAFDQARDSLQVDSRLIALIRQLKAESNGQLRVFAMSNLSPADHEAIRAKIGDLSVLDQIFISGVVGERKPDLGFYRHVLKAADVDPRRVIFVDDLFENVFSARSLGMYGIVVKSPEQLERDLLNLLTDPVERGREFLRRNAGRLDSETQSTDKHTSVTLYENWSQLLILEAMGDRYVSSLSCHLFIL